MQHDDANKVATRLPAAAKRLFGLCDVVKTWFTTTKFPFESRTLTVTINLVVTTRSSSMTNDTKNLSRGLLSKKTGVNSETIRYYEKIRLMPDPLRSANGYRIYDDSQLKRLAFIKRCRELGFTLKEITVLLQLVDGDSYTCAEIRDHTKSHLQDVDDKIRDLRKMQQTLRDMVSECEGDSVPKCPIVEALFVS